MTMVSPTQLLCVCGAQRLPGSLRSLDEALWDFPASWNIKRSLWAGARLCLPTLGNTGVTQPQQCRGACAGSSFGMI